MDAQALRLAQLVAVVASAGFSFGGFIGILYSDDPPAAKAVAFAPLAVLLGLHLRNCVRRADGRRPRGWRWTLAVQAVLTGAGLVWFASTWYGNTGFLAAAVLLLIRRPGPRWGAFSLVLLAQFLSGLTVRPTVSEALYLMVGQGPPSSGSRCTAWCGWPTSSPTCAVPRRAWRRPRWPVSGWPSPSSSTSGWVRA
ncbi:hypothetical protein [Nonomuraea dietziae]|uniref:hypothetical protein n=1 Tax=Nonomuraea dietziae TaxID=65515 RepID=UPI0031D2BFAA